MAGGCPRQRRQGRTRGGEPRATEGEENALKINLNLNFANLKSADSDTSSRLRSEVQFG